MLMANPSCSPSSKVKTEKAAGRSASEGVHYDRVLQDSLLTATYPPLSIASRRCSRSRELLDHDRVERVPCVHALLGGPALCGQANQALLRPWDVVASVPWRINIDWKALEDANERTLTLLDIHILTPHRKPRAQQPGSWHTGASNSYSCLRNLTVAIEAARRGSWSGGATYAVEAMCRCGPPRRTDTLKDQGRVYGRGRF